MERSSWFSWTMFMPFLSPGRTRAVYNTLAEKLANKAGILLHTGKTRVWNREGVCLPNFEDLGPDVWSSRGVKILGTLVGSDVFV